MHSAPSPTRAPSEKTVTFRSCSVVIPVYNSASLLKGLVEELMAVLTQLELVQWEVLLVNDGSRDTSWSVIAELARDHPEITGICLMRNYGQHNALLCGIRAAHGEVIITMDDDQQHPAEHIPLLLSELAQGYDVVYATPLTEQHGLFRNLASRLTKIALQSTMGAETARKVSAFRAFRTPLREAALNYQSPFVSVDVLLTWATTRFSALPLPHRPRPEGTSNYTFGRLVSHALNMMTGFSTFPLQIASVTGFFFTLFGLGILAYVLGRYFLQGTSVPGFPFLASVIAIFSGAQLFALGIIGEYLARMHFRTMEKPTYLVRAVTLDDREAR